MSVAECQYGYIRGFATKEEAEERVAALIPPKGKVYVIYGLLPSDDPASINTPMAYFFQAQPF